MGVVPSDFRLLFTLIWVFVAMKVNAVKIQSMVVPDLVNINSSDSLTLDCIFEFDDSSEDPSIVNKSLVIKWSLNNILIFQWSITAKHKPFVSSIIKDRIMEEQKHPIINGRPKNMPLTILNKTVDLRGLYECKVTTVLSEDMRQKYMHVYVKFPILITAPVSELVLEEHLDVEFNVLNVSCSAQGIYPQPVITMSMNNLSVKNASDYIIQDMDPLYDISATYSIETDDLPSITTFNCSLDIPEVNLTYNKVLQYAKAGYNLIGNGDSSSEQQVGGQGSNLTIQCNLYSISILIALPSLMLLNQFTNALR